MVARSSSAGFCVCSESLLVRPWLISPSVNALSECLDEGDSPHVDLARLRKLCLRGKDLGMLFDQQLIQF
jgi:hypothetical protein